MGNKLCKDPVPKSSICLSPDWDIDADFSVKGVGLSKSEIITVTEFWTNFTGRETVMTQSVFLISFYRLFIHDPKLQDLFFVNSRLLTLEEWKEYPLFMSHMERIKAAMDMTISLLDDHYVCLEYLKTLACFHQSSWMKIFDDELDNSLSDLYTEEVKNAFRKLLTIMFDKLTVGLT